MGSSMNASNSEEAICDHHQFGDIADGEDGNDSEDDLCRGPCRYMRQQFIRNFCLLVCLRQMLAGYGRWLPPLRRHTCSPTDETFLPTTASTMKSIRSCNARESTDVSAQAATMRSTLEPTKPYHAPTRPSS